MEVPRHWRLKKQRYSLRGEICDACKTPLFPPRAVCPHCGGDASEGSLRKNAMNNGIKTREGVKIGQ